MNYWREQLARAALCWGAFAFLTMIDGDDTASVAAILVGGGAWIVYLLLAVVE